MIINRCSVFRKDIKKEKEYKLKPKGFGVNDRIMKFDIENEISWEGG